MEFERGRGRGDDTSFDGSLDGLTRLNGVALAFMFSADGNLLEYKASTATSRESAEQAAQFCATVSMLFNTLASAFTQMSGMKWVPQHTWTYSGGDWLVVIGGRRGVFAERSKADIDELMRALQI